MSGPGSIPRRLVVVGGASLDVLHFAGRTVRSAGGAGLYSALAAQRAGAEVTMVGPRPRPVPAELQVAMERLDWRGPEVSPRELPSFEIAHRGGGITEMLQVHWRAEAELAPEALPSNLPAGLVYCIPLADPGRQLEFVRYFKQQGRQTACGTFACAISERRQVVEETLAAADIFFCNRTEAEELFGSLDRAEAAPGKLLFITLGAEGVRVLQGSHGSDVPAVTVEELDPTGAGDAFCGTVLALLAQGAHPVAAARRGVATAAEVVTAVGPAALLAPPAPQPVGDARVRTEPGRIREVARVLRQVEDFEPFDFVGDSFPPVGHPAAVEFFFAATLQQFGFWSEDEGRYVAPLVASVAGRRLKGSDFLWSVYRRWLEQDPRGFAPAAQAVLRREEFDERCRADSGRNPLPSVGERLRQARAYAWDMEALGWTPASIVERANSDPRPLQTFLGQMDRVGGYKEDPLRKKSALLATILQGRPERFLRLGDGEELPPIIDYHLQRSCLRVGLIEVVDEDLRGWLERRECVSEDDEAAVREACFEALLELRAASGRPMAALDRFFFENRHRCPEMTEPECARCPLDPACAHRTALFQPVFRTPFY